jgi:hypothetical protein
MVRSELLAIENNHRRLSTSSGGPLTVTSSAWNTLDFSLWFSLARCVDISLSYSQIDLWFSLAGILQFTLIVRLPLQESEI